MSTDTSPTLDPPDTDTDEPVDEPVFADTVTDPTPTDATQAAPTTRRTSRPWYRPRWKPLFLRLHRWISFAFLIPVLVWFLSGIPLMFHSQVDALFEPDLNRSTSSAQPMDIYQAEELVRTQYPDTLVTFAHFGERGHGVIAISHRDPQQGDLTTYVDPGARKINGTIHADHPSTHTTAMGFLGNLHDFALAQEGMPGYVPFMADPLPVVGWQAGHTVTVLIGFATAFLAVSGLVLWWPGVKRWTRGFRLRGKSFYIFNFDLHHVLGFAAVPFVLMWGLTTMAFWVPQLKEAWMAVTFTDSRSDAEFETAFNDGYAGVGATGPEVTVQQAEQAARAVAPGVTQVCFITYPDPENGINAYDFVFRGKYQPCETDVIVSLKGARTTVIQGHGRPFAESLWIVWFSESHFGGVVNSTWRLIWVFFALSSVVLSFTGVVMWWRRWRNRRRRRTAALTAEATA